MSIASSIDGSLSVHELSTSGTLIEVTVPLVCVSLVCDPLV